MYLEDILQIVFTVIIAIVPFTIGGLLMKWAFGGKKEDKKKNEKLFEATAFLNAVQPTLPRKLR